MVKLACIVPYAHETPMSPVTLHCYRRPLGVLGAVGLVLLLGSCARISDTAQSMFVSTTPAVATVGTQVLTGKLHVYADGTGFVALEGDASQQPLLRCSGSLPVSGFLGRDIYLRCNSGVQARVALSMRTELRGYGYGSDGDVPVSLAFGLEPPEVLALLKWPADRRLEFQEGRYTLGVADAAANPLPPAPATPLK